VGSQGEEALKGLARLTLLAALGLAALCLTSSPAAALDLGQWVPGLRLSPFLSQRVDYESNVFQTPSHEQDDVIFKTIPGFLADYTFGPHSASVGYRAEILNYLDLTTQDTTHHIAVGQLSLDYPRLLVNLRDDFTQTSDPPGTELTGRVLSKTNVLKPEAEYRLTSRFSTGLAYAWTWVRFDERSVSEDIDRDEHLVAASVFWKFVPRADLVLSYAYGWTSFARSSDRDYTRHLVTLGVRGDLTPKLASSFRMGVLVRDPDRSDHPGYTGLAFGGDFTYRPTERTTIVLLADRSPQESTFLTTDFYVTTNATLTAQHQLLPKLSVGARVGGGANDYSTKQTVGTKTDWRYDTFVAAGANAEYSLQPWLRLGFEYLWSSRDSNFSPFEFVDNVVTGRLTFQF
jgi:hypothetical protein